MIKIVSFGSSNPIQAISEGVEKIGTRDGMCCHDCAIEEIINEILRG